MLDARDAKNLLVIMNKVEYKGLDEAMVAVVLRGKLEQIVNQPDPVPAIPDIKIETPEGE